MIRSHIGSVSCSDLIIDAKLEEHQMLGCKQCPNCGHKLDRKPDWIGLPAGVKFDPTDQELIEHLEAKVKFEDKSHPLIDEFIPTLEGEDGICYTHPEKLPGVTRDGLSKHFFHRPSKAYTTGTRKRRKIQTECDLQRGETRWHKTGKTRPVMVHARQKGCKKILVLYTNFGKHKKPEKTNWVMHQYHLGELEEEKEGELVVSKIFYQTQPRQCSWTDKNPANAVSVVVNVEGLESRRESASGSSSSKEMYGTAMDQMQQMKPDNFSFAPFRNTFDHEVGMGETRPCKPRDQVSLHGHDENEEAQDRHHHRPPHHHVTHEHHHQHRQDQAMAAFHVSRPTNPISTIMSPAGLHQPTIVLDDPAAYHVSTNILLQNEKFQKQQHQHQKLVERSAAGLEEIIMGCTSADINKGETSTRQSTQQTDLLHYTYWSPYNQNQHG